MAAAAGPTWKHRPMGWTYLRNYPERIGPLLGSDGSFGALGYDEGEGLYVQCGACGLDEGFDIPGSIILDLRAIIPEATDSR